MKKLAAIIAALVVLVAAVVYVALPHGTRRGTVTETGAAMAGGNLTQSPDTTSPEPEAQRPDRRSELATANVPLTSAASKPRPASVTPPTSTPAAGDFVSQVRKVRTEVQGTGDAPPALLQALEGLLSSESEQRAEAVQDVGFLGDARVLPPIFHLLATDPAPEVRAAAAASLDTHADSAEASIALVRALKDKEEEVRDNALLSLKAHRSPATQQELQRALASGEITGELAEEAKLLLDLYYVRKDPFKDPLGN